MNSEHSKRKCSRPLIGLAVLVLVALARVALAQHYPSKPVKLVVPFAAGGTPDIVGRILAQGMSQGLGQPIVIDNRPGAAGTVGMEAAAKAPSDGYTLILGTTGTLASAPGLYPNLAYDPLNGFAPVSLVSSAPYVVAVHPSAGASLKEFIELARSKPGQLNFASFGSGGPPHIAGEMFKGAAGVDLTHVPYKVMANAVTDLVTGRIHVMFNNFTQFQAHIQTGKLTPLAIAGPKRIVQLPNVPTAAEAGLPGYDVSTWFGLLAPKGTSREIVTKLNAEVVRALRAREVQDSLLAQGFEPTGSTPDRFAAFIATETEKWSRAIKTSGAKLE